jgi:hypothetical protein
MYNSLNGNEEGPTSPVQAAYDLEALAGGGNFKEWDTMGKAQSLGVDLFFNFENPEQEFSLLDLLDSSIEAGSDVKEAWDQVPSSSSPCSGGLSPTPYIPCPNCNVNTPSIYR